MNRSQQGVIEYPQEDNRVLREQLGSKRPLFTDRPATGQCASPETYLSEESLAAARETQAAHSVRF